MDTHGTAAHFVTVDDHIVRIGNGLFRRGFQLSGRHVFRRGKRMVHRGQATFTVVFKHWEVDNPQRRPFGFVGQAQIFTQFQTQCAH
ncbi:hypothetical protein D3C73_1354330 [compost metagenome]